MAIRSFSRSAHPGTWLNSHVMLLVHIIFVGKPSQHSIPNPEWLLCGFGLLLPRRLVPIFLFQKPARLARLSSDSRTIKHIRTRKTIGLFVGHYNSKDNAAVGFGNHVAFLCWVPRVHAQFAGTRADLARSSTPDRARTPDARPSSESSARCRSRSAG